MYSRERNPEEIETSVKSKNIIGGVGPVVSWEGKEVEEQLSSLLKPRPAQTERKERLLAKKREEEA